MTAREHHPGCIEEGLHDKYSVRRKDGQDMPGGRHYGCTLFVLDLTHDPSARYAARMFAEDVADERPQLSVDVLDLLERMEVRR